MSDKEEFGSESTECAICFSLRQAAIALVRISNNIAMSCAGNTRKKDFGLEKSFVDSQISVLKKMIKYHQYYDATGNSLNDGEFGVYSGGDKPSPPKFKRFRPK